MNRYCIVYSILLLSLSIASAHETLDEFYDKFAELMDVTRELSKLGEKLALNKDGSFPLMLAEPLLELSKDLYQVSTVLHDMQTTIDVMKIIQEITDNVSKKDILRLLSRYEVKDYGLEDTINELEEYLNREEVQEYLKDKDLGEYLNQKNWDHILMKEPVEHPNYKEPIRPYREIVQTRVMTEEDLELLDKNFNVTHTE